MLILANQDRPMFKRFHEFVIEQNNGNTEASEQTALFAKLEEQNEQLKAEIEQAKAKFEKLASNYVALCDEMAELQKENAELKSKLSLKEQK